MPPRVAQGEILRALVGSTLHGTGRPDQEDTDYMGVCVEPWQAVLGLEHFEQWIWRSQPEGVRSGYGDIDITVYGLRKFLSLAVKGNPTILTALFVPEEYLAVVTDLGRELQALAPSIVSKQAAMPFAGYLKAQRERLEGVRGGRHTNRPELIGEHGYDTKYAMHALRLAFQGQELLATGRITLPVPNPWGDQLRSIRRGEVPYELYLAILKIEEERLFQAAEASPLPDLPDRDRVNSFAAKARLVTWPEALAS